MLIDPKYYTILRNDVPVLTRQANGSYINTNNYFINVRLIGETIKQIVKPFGFGDDILTAIDKSYGKFNVFEFAALTTPNITTPDFNTDEDTLAIGLYHITGPKSYV